MYLIKCAKCNNLVEVKTEFLMLCPKCKMKLENNYQDWRQLKENKGKNFPTYLNEVCISSEELEEHQRQERLEKLYSPKKNKIRKILNIAFGAIVLAASIVLAVRLTRLLGESWMRATMLAMNISLGVIGGALASYYAWKRVKFQDFLPILLGIITFALIVASDMAFFIFTDNL